jgi:PadR family transcriptional regulator
MSKGDHLGEFEQLVLWALVRLGANAYGVTIRQELEKRTGRNVSIGAVYTTLERLEDKGYVSSRLGEVTPERGGKAKRYFTITGAGAQALNDLREVLVSMWRGVKFPIGEAI